jgi:hypothetical protein
MFSIAILTGMSRYAIDDEDESSAETPPLFWWLTGAAAIVILLISVLTSADQSGNVLRHLLAGIKALPSYCLAFPGLVIAAGATLGANDTKTSLKYCAIAACIVSGCIALILFANSVISFELPVQPQESTAMIDQIRTSQETQRTVSSVFMFAMIPMSFAIFLIPLLVASAAASIVGHLALNALNNIPMPWQDTDDRPESWLQDVAAGAVIVGLAVCVFVWPALKSAKFVNDPEGEAQYVVSRLDDRLDDHPQGPLINSSAGREAMERSAHKLEERLALADKNDCFAIATLDESLESYFRNIRIYEDWRPGKEYSKYSKRALTVLTKSLERKYVGWEDLARYVTIHLSQDKYGATAAIRQGKCSKS